MRKRRTEKQRLAIFLAHGGRCYRCGVKLIAPDYDLDHVTALGLGGADEDANLRPICRACHRGAGGKSASDKTKISKADRIAGKAADVRQSRRPMPGSRRSPWKRKMNGKAERR